MLPIRTGIDAVGEISTFIASRLGAYLHLVASTHVETVVRLTLRDDK